MGNCELDFVFVFSIYLYRNFNRMSVVFYCSVKQFLQHCRIYNSNNKQWNLFKVGHEGNKVLKMSRITRQQQHRQLITTTMAAIIITWWLIRDSAPRRVITAIRVREVADLILHLLLVLAELLTICHHHLHRHLLRKNSSNIWKGFNNDLPDWGKMKTDY